MELIIREANEGELLQAHQLIKQFMDNDFSIEKFEWKHLKNPIGKAICIVGVENDRIIGFNFFSPHIITVDNQDLLFYRSSESLVLPAGRGKGVFTRIQDYFNKNYSENSKGVFGTPNANSIGIFKKMGWTTFEIKTSFFFNLPFSYSNKVTFSDYKSNYDYKNVNWDQSIKYNFNWRINVEGYHLASLDESKVIYEIIQKKGLKVIKVLYKIGFKEEVLKIFSTIQIKEKAILFIDVEKTYLKHIYKKSSSSYDFGYLLFDTEIDTQQMNSLKLSLGDLDKIF